MNDVHINGTIVFEPEAETWSSMGTGWWIEKSIGNVAKITFEELLVFNLKSQNFSLSISNIDNNGDIQTYHVDETGFIIAWNNYNKSSNCVASFSANGIKKIIIPNDRTLKNEENAEDIYAASLLFNHEAKYGVVTVMGSASFSSEEMLAEQETEARGLIRQYQTAIEESADDFSKMLFSDKLNKSRYRLERLVQIREKSIAYWNSAKKFGELWGRYSAQEQESILGGCYVPICTGGGPGIMRAVAEGARGEHAHVIGIDCQFGNDNFFNLKDSFSALSNQRLRLNNFSIREGVLINYSHVILFWPGGYGTAWEACETLSKISTNHLRRHRTKVIFVHTEYWEPFFAFIDHMRTYGAINAYGDRIKIPTVDDTDAEEAYLAEVVDTAEEAFAKTRDFVETLYKKNQLTLRD